MNRHWLQSPGLALLALIAGCADEKAERDAGPPVGQTCWDAECIGTMAIEFSPPLSTPGRWTIGVTGEGLEQRCSLELPTSIGMRCMQEDQTPADVGYVTESTAAGLKTLKLDRLGHELHPPQLTVTLAYEGIPVGDATFEPAWELRQPNGPDCGPTCYVAPTITMQTSDDEADAG